MTDKVDICRKAASFLKSVNIVIENLDDPTTPLEETFNLWYDDAKEIALSSTLWTFALKEVTLAKSSEVPSFGYKAKFNKPSDLITPAYYYINNERIFHKEFKAEVMGVHICTMEDYDTLPMLYIADIEEGFMTRTFSAYMAAELAILATNEINASDNELVVLQNLRDELYEKANKVDSSRRFIDIEEKPGNIAAPYGFANTDLFRYEG